VSEEEIQDIQARIEDLKMRWPKHSVPPAMIEQLDDLEEQLAQAKRKSETDEHAQTEKHD